jgi:hypothetical protein
MDIGNRDDPEGSLCKPSTASCSVSIAHFRTPQIFLVSELFYFVANGFQKVSILLFMLRIFPERSFQTKVYVLCGITVSYTLAFVLATLFQCQPVSHFWMQIDDHVVGQCNNINLQAWLSAVFNIILDLMILILPIKSLWALQLSLARKITAIAMFSLGILYGHPPRLLNVCHG